MKISVITVCKNAEKYIEQCVRSVIEQTYSDIEYIIVDGDSQDRTKEIIRKYADYISRFISEPDGGLYQAMNKGIRYSSGDFICFINADDYFIDAAAIQDAADFLSYNPSCDFLYGDLELRYSPEKKVLVQSVPPDKVAEELICGCIPHQASFARADLFFSKIGFFNEGYRISSDYEWFLRLIQNETVKLCHFSRTITSYYAAGLSSQVRLSVPESYRIQNQFPLYQEHYWLKRRIEKYQEFVINLREWLAQTESHRDALEAENRRLKSQYQALMAQYQEIKITLEESQSSIATSPTPASSRSRF